MTQEEKRIKLAEAAGIKHGVKCSSTDYFNNLNAVHELEKRMSSKHWTRYCQYLADFGRGATATQHAEALGLTLNLW